MRLRNKWRQCLALATVTAMMASTPMPAYAGTWYLDEGDITVRSSDEEGTNLVSQNETRDQRDTDTVITNSRPESNDNGGGSSDSGSSSNSSNNNSSSSSSSSGSNNNSSSNSNSNSGADSGSSSSSSSSTNHTITIDTGDSADNKVEVTLKDVNIDVSNGNSAGQQTAAVTVTGQGETTIELDGDNSVSSAKYHAGIEKNGTDGSLIIQDEKAEEGRDDAATLTATGGIYGAGIGGGDGGDGTNITIKSGALEATGGASAAGIGGGYDGDGNNITITGGEATATGGSRGAGIGGGYGGDGTAITITDGEVTATAGLYASGIGGGISGDAVDILITGGEVIATGRDSGAGIGGGSSADATNITITGGTVTATGGAGASGIGGGWYKGDGNNIAITGGEVTATGGSGGSGIGGGLQGNGNNISISGGEVDATGGSGAAGIGGGTANSGGGLIGGNGQGITISGGNVTAIGGYQGSGIGGGQSGDGTGITITGGTVYANTNLGSGRSSGQGAGIGGGSEGNGTDITITGGDVTAVSHSYAAAIGGGYKRYGDVSIEGGTVNAQAGSSGAGIGGGYYGNGTVIITGGEVVATGGKGAAAIGDGMVGTGSNVSITGGIVTATGGKGAAAIGSGQYSTKADVVIGDQAAVVATKGKGSDVYIGSASVPVGSYYIKEGYSGTDFTENIDTSCVYYNHDGTYTHSSGNDGEAITYEVLHYAAAADGTDGYTGTTFDNGRLTAGATLRCYQPATDTEDGFSGDSYDPETDTFTPGVVLRHPVAATETTDGFSGDTVDENGQVVLGQVIHGHETKSVIAPTASDEGSRTYTCSICGELIRVEIIPQLTGYYPATTEASGYTGDTYDVENDVVIPGETIAQLLLPVEETADTAVEQNTGVVEQTADNVDVAAPAAAEPAAPVAETVVEEVAAVMTTDTLRVLDRASQDVTDNTAIVSQNTAGTVRTIHAERLAIGTLEGTLQDLLDLQAQGITTVVYVTAYRTSTLHIADLVGLGSGMTRFVLYHAADAASLTVGGVSYGGLIR